MKERVYKSVFYTFLVACIGLLYYLFGKFTGIYIPCLFHKITGLYCPGCGVTRMLTALLEGHVQKAFDCNEAVFLLLPFLGAVFIRHLRRYILGIRKKATRLEMALTYFALAAVILFGILRNIPYFYFLRPPLT